MSKALISKAAVAAILATTQINYSPETETVQNVDVLEDASFVAELDRFSKGWHWGTNKANASPGPWGGWDHEEDSDDDPQECSRSRREDYQQCMASATSAAQEQACDAILDKWCP